MTRRTKKEEVKVEETQLKKEKAVKEKPKTKQETKKETKKEIKEAEVIVEAEVEETKEEVKVEPTPEKKKDDGIVANKRIVNDIFIGDVSSDMKYELERSEDEEEKVYQELLQAKEKGKILWGLVAGVDVDTSNNHAIITVIYNGVRVLMLDSGFFEPNWNFGEGYEQLSEKEKVERRLKGARLTIGAHVPFIVKGVEKQSVIKGNLKGEKEVVAVATRTEALAKLRDIYFLHKETKEPVDVYVNDQANANVIYVHENFVTVECLGVETRINAYSLNEDYVENCNDFVSVGDVIKVRIKKITIEGDRVILKASGRLNLGAKAIGSIKINGSYLGVVESYNKNKNIYTCKLKNGVNASVHRNSIMGHIELNVGDKVAVLVKAIEEDYVIGVALKI